MEKRMLLITRCLRPLLVASVVFLPCLLLSAKGSKQANRPGTGHLQAWIGARIIDGSGRPPIENATLLARGGRIEAVGAKIKIPPDAEKIDAKGKTIIPGLINAHGHVNDPAQFGVYLRDGITTVLSLGGAKEFALREEATKSQPGTAPHLYVAGPIAD